MISEDGIDEELRQLDELNDRYFRFGFGREFDKRINQIETQDAIRKELGDSLKAIRRNHMTNVVHL